MSECCVMRWFFCWVNKKSSDELNVDVDVVFDDFWSFSFNTWDVQQPKASAFGVRPSDVVGSSGRWRPQILKQILGKFWFSSPNIGCLHEFVSILYQKCFEYILCTTVLNFEPYSVLSGSYGIVNEIPRCEKDKTYENLRMITSRRWR